MTRIARRGVGVVAPLCIALALGCHSGGNSGPAPVASISVALSPANVQVGATAQATAILKDAAGNVLADRTITWTSTAAGIATIDAAGVVSTLAPGSADITATSEGQSGFATVAVVAGPPSRVAKVEGDDQSAAPGAPVPTAPVVSVTDARGFAVAGVDVTFTVASGGGSVAVSHALTGADGRATCGGWTLGPTIGVQTVSASIAGAPGVTFAAVAARRSGDVTVSLLAPTGNPLVDTTFTVAATVTSTYQLASVSANAGAGAAGLTYGPFGRYRTPAWSGTVSAAGLPSGTIVVMVTAVDVLGAATDAFVRVRLDPPPRVALASPAPESLARPTLQVSASCADDAPAGCVSLVLSVGGTTLLSGQNALAGTVDLGAYEGQAVELVLTGKDTSGQSALLTRKAYVESSATLDVLFAVTGNTIWDVAGTRVLYVDSSGAAPTLRILERGAGTIEDVETGTGLTGTYGGYGFLTPTGALYAHGDAGAATYPYCWLYEWRGGSLANLGGLNSCQSLKVAGRYAVFSEDSTLVRRDLDAAVNTTVSTDAGNWRNDVAANGDVVYWTGSTYAIVRWRPGGAQQLTNDAAGVMSTYPVTDGQNVVYRTSGRRIALHDGTTETVLTSSSTGDPTPGTDYAVAGGFAAYFSTDGAQVAHVWRHGPSGEEQVTRFGTSSTIDGLAPDGTILLVHGGRRYRAAPGAALQEIGSSLGKTILRDGAFHVLIGRTVLRILP